MTHIPVLYHETLAGLKVNSGKNFIDGTVGAGGHAAGILQASAPSGLLIGLDRDPQALQSAHKRLQEFSERVWLVQGSYTQMGEVARAHGWAQADGIVLDLGLSSLQLADPERGFSFQADGPLDMRFDPGAPASAADLVNGLTEGELTAIIAEFGEETPRTARRIAQAIVAARPVNTTAALAAIVAEAAGRGPRGRRKVHPATRTFQALRIAVNDELEQVRQGIPVAMELLVRGGRLAIISFHSLEDRIVKDAFRLLARGPAYDPARPALPGEEFRPTATLVTRKPIVPGPEELESNARSRSAKLRIIEKIA